MVGEKINGFATKEGLELEDMQESDRAPVKHPEDEECHDEETNPVSPERDDGSRVKWRNLVAFWILGLCNNYGYVVMLSAAHDILDSKSDTNDTTATTVSTIHLGNVTDNLADSSTRDCNLLSTGAILLADIIPALLTKLVAPFFPLVIHVRMVMMLVLGSAGYILVGASKVTWVAILGVICTAFSSGIGEASLLSYMPFFKQNVISTWSSGTGGAGILGSFSYAFFLSIGMSPSTTLYVMLVVPALMAVTFWAILKKPMVEEARSEVATPANYGSTSIHPSDASDRIPLTYTNETFSEKLKSIPPLLKYMIPLGLVYLFEYFINQGLFELVYFDGTFLSHAEQYRWYQVLYQVGVFISRSSINVVQIKHIWILALLQGLNVIIIGAQAIYSFIPSVYIIIVLVLWEGLLGGAAYVNTFHAINSQVPPEKREFSMAIATVADSFGITIAGFLAIPAHNYICGLPPNL